MRIFTAILATLLTLAAGAVTADGNVASISQVGAIAATGVQFQTGTSNTA